MWIIAVSSDIILPRSLNKFFMVRNIAASSDIIFPNSLRL